MKKTIKLTENDLTSLVKKIINEQKPKESVKDTRKNFSQMVELKSYSGCIVQKHHGNTLRVNCPNSTIDDGIFFDVKVS